MMGCRGLMAMVGHRQMTRSQFNPGRHLHLSGIVSPFSPPVKTPLSPTFPTVKIFISANVRQVR